jgi:hypothetical protein
VSLVEKPEPDTIIVDPAEPEPGLKDMDGTVTGSVELILICVVI